MPSQIDTPNDVTIGKIRLVLLTETFPEQYDAYYGTHKIGYLRLRHGQFTVEYKNVGGERLHTASPKGDGQFLPEERLAHLTAATEKLAARWRKDRHQAR